MQPILNTSRLTLRPFLLSDAERVVLLANNEKIADVTANIPYPYPKELAHQWISGHSKRWKSGDLSSFAMILNRENLLLGCISVMNIKDGEGELGYWVGEPYWGKGYCTEACRAAILYGFTHLQLNRIHAKHLSRNPASGRVLLNSGLQHIGTDKASCGYRGECESIEVYEIFKP